MQIFDYFMKRRSAVSALLVAMTMSVSGCAVTSLASAPQVQPGDSIALLPIMNLTETPQAGARAEAITEALLRAKGFELKRFTGATSSDVLFQNIDNETVKQAAASAHAQHMKYGLTGSVIEWRYKVGVDGEPAVGIALKLINLETNEVIWAASGSRAGWSRTAVSGEAQKLLGQLLKGMTP